MVGIVHQMTSPAGSGVMPPVLAGRKAEQEEVAWHWFFFARRPAGQAGQDTFWAAGQRQDLPSVLAGASGHWRRRGRDWLKPDEVPTVAALNAIMAGWTVVSRGVVMRQLVASQR